MQCAAEIFQVIIFVSRSKVPLSVCDNYTVYRDDYFFLFHPLCSSDSGQVPLYQKSPSFPVSGTVFSVVKVLYSCACVGLLFCGVV